MALSIVQIGGKYEKKKIIFSRADRYAKLDIKRHFRGKFDVPSPQPAGSKYILHERQGYFAANRFTKSGTIKPDYRTSEPSPSECHMRITQSQETSGVPIGKFATFSTPLCNRGVDGLAQQSPSPSRNQFRSQSRSPSRSQSRSPARRP
mmetsp:Transcript_2866/g.3960  ORF Transcript_2866/g.3960 Transcript_2866/m.3960 type:complete len:149 (+) Transcript_2866:107-553(+)